MQNLITKMSILTDNENIIFLNTKALFSVANKFLLHEF